MAPEILWFASFSFHEFRKYSEQLRLVCHNKFRNFFHQTWRMNPFCIMLSLKTVTKKTKKLRDFTKFSLFQNLALIFTCLPFAVCTKILRVEEIRTFSIEYRTENDHGDENRHTIPQLVHFLAMVIANSALKSYTESADSSKSRASNQCHLCIHRWPQTCTAN